MATQLVDSEVNGSAQGNAPTARSEVHAQIGRSYADQDLLWPLVANILAAQRGRPYPELEKILGENPFAGLPPTVKHALEQTAKAYEATTRDDTAPPTGPGSNETRVSHAPVIDNKARYELRGFCERHRLLMPKDGKIDEHYAERKFLELVVLPVLGPSGLTRLTPQESFI